MGIFGGKSRNNLLIKAIENNDLGDVNAILSKDNKNNETININEKNKEGNYPLLLAIKNNNFEIVYAIIEYANKNKILLTLEDYNKDREYPLLLAAKNNNMKLVYILIDYANLNNIILNIEQKGTHKFYPLFFAAKNDNTEMVKLFIDYAEEHEIVMGINDLTMFNDNPLIRSIFNYNSEIITLIIDYSKKYKIKTNVQCVNRNVIYNENLLFGICDEVSDNRKQKQKEKEKQKKITLLNQKKQMLLNQNGNSIDKNDPNYSEAIVLYDFNSSNSQELNVSKGEYIVVTDWNVKDGWVFGYRKSNPRESGIIPRLFINRYVEDNTEGDLVCALYDFIGNTSNELEFKKNDYLRILDWNVREGWIYGYVDGNRQKKGNIPKLFIRRVYYENQDHLPSYEEVMIQQNKEE